MSPPAGTPRNPGLAAVVLWCRRDGHVLTCPYDGVGLDLDAGDRLDELVPAEQARDLLALLAAGADGEHGPPHLTISLGSERRSLVAVAGPPSGPAPATDRVLVVAAQEDATATSLLHLLQQVTAVPATSAVQAPPDDPDRAHVELLDSFTETNNALMGLHRDLAKQGRALTEANRHLQEILATVAHDLRNPLGVIIGLATTLRRDITGPQDPGSDQLLERIEAQGRRMLDLVEDLLDAAVIERGVISLELEPVGLRSLLDEVVPAHTEAAKRKDITLALDLDDAPDTVRVDRVRFGQVLDNLLSNAVKFTERDRGAVITVRADVDGDRWHLVVRDEGVGISPERLDDLFEPFRGSGTVGTDGEPTTGLGLAISRSVVAAHGGHIAVDSTPGVGTTVTVNLPLDDRSDA